jgi:hypothetical protein
MYSSRASRLTSATHRKGDVSTLIGQPQDDDSGVRAGRILAGITEIEVERDEQPALGRRLAADYKIGGPPRFSSSTVQASWPNDSNSVLAALGRFSSSLNLTTPTG